MAAKGVEADNTPFIKSTDLGKLTPQTPLIKGVLNKEGLGLLIASFGLGKTFTALDIGLKVARGENWCGHRTKTAPLVYVNLEGRIHNRVRAWENKNGEAPVFLVFESGQFDINSKAFLERFVRHCPHGAFIIIDTLAIASCGANLDRAEEVTAVYNKLRGIIRATGGTILIVAHLGKDDSKGAAGSHQIGAQADAIISIDKNGNISADKVRDGERHKIGSLSLEVVTLGEDEDGDAITSCCVNYNGYKPSTLRLSPTLSCALESLVRIARRTETDGTVYTVPVTLEDWREGFYSDHTGDTIEAKKKAFQRARASLVERNILLCKNNIYTLNKQNWAGTDGTIPGQVPMSRMADNRDRRDNTL